MAASEDLLSNDDPGKNTRTGRGRVKSAHERFLDRRGSQIFARSVQQKRFFDGTDMGNPRKPTQLKAIAGTERKDRASKKADVELPPLADVPEAPDWLPNAHAVKEWNRLAPILVANKMLAEADLGTLGHMCALHGKIVQLYAAGEAPAASMVGTLRTLQNDFGLSPVARGKVTPTGSEEGKGNPFKANGKRGKSGA